MLHVGSIGVTSQLTDKKNRDKSEFIEYDFVHVFFFSNIYLFFKIIELFYYSCNDSIQ